MLKLSQGNTLSVEILSKRLGITAKAVEKRIAGMKADEVLRRIVPNKGRY